MLTCLFLILTFRITHSSYESDPMLECLLERGVWIFSSVWQLLCLFECLAVSVGQKFWGVLFFTNSINSPVRRNLYVFNYYYYYYYYNISLCVFFQQLTLSSITNSMSLINMFMLCEVCIKIQTFLGYLLGDFLDIAESCFSSNIQNRFPPSPTPTTNKS